MTIAPGIIVPQVEIEAICRRYEIRELSIFGSALRGEILPTSDIDLLVDFLPGAEVSLFRHAAAEREFSELLGRRVDLVSKRALRATLRDEILSQARLVYRSVSTSRYAQRTINMKDRGVLSCMKRSDNRSFGHG
jgi:predicted nucleotidyltransferase